ncbi:unnamed protein product [Diamesa hyperborea]
MAEAEVGTKNVIKNIEKPDTETMENTENNEEKSGDEECPEFDDDYFNDIENTFDVIDAWDVKDGDSNGADVKDPNIVKQEIKSEKSIDKKENKSTSENGKAAATKKPVVTKKPTIVRRPIDGKKPTLTKDPRQLNKPVGREKEARLKSNSKDREKDKSKEKDRKKSPERRPIVRSRSPVPYRRNRFEPPGGRRRRSRSTERSPLRRRESPPRRQATKKGFLDELKETFASQGKDFPEIDMIRNQNPNQNPNQNQNSNQNPYKNNIPNMFGMPSFVQQQMMNGVFPGGPQPVPAPFLNPYVQQNMGFPGIVNPMDPYAGYAQMNPNQFGMPVVNPYQQMVPEVKQINPESFPSPVSRSIPVQKSNDPRLLKAAVAPKKPLIEIEDEPRQKATSTSIDFEEIKKKAFKEGKIGLTDYLKQVSHQNKNVVKSDLVTKRDRVIERCKLTKKLMDEYETLNYRPQFVQFMGAPLQKKQLLEKNKSPLIMNENNAQFLSQTPVARCRDALINFPFKNLTRKMFEMSRTLGVDIAELSKEVQKRVEQEKELGDRRLNSNHSESIMNLRVRHFGMQTMKTSCEECKKREEIDFITVGTQSERSSLGKGVDRGVQTAAGTTDGFSYFVESMRDLSEEQIRAIEDFKRAMNIRDDGRGFLKHESKERRHEASGSRERSTSDYMSWSNPENPNTHEATYNDYRGGSPKRSRIGARLGDKVPSPVPFIDLDDLEDNPYYGESSRPKRLYGYVPKSMQRSPKRVARDHSPGVPGMADPRDYYRRESPPPTTAYRGSRESYEQAVDPYLKYDRSRSRSPEYAARRGRY